jgi:hypothetical protein
MGRRTPLPSYQPPTICKHNVMDGRKICSPNPLYDSNAPCLSYSTKNGYFVPNNPVLAEQSKKLSLNIYYSTNKKQENNVELQRGINAYNSAKNHIEKYVGKIGCVSVNDLATTYNALNEALGISGRLPTRSEAIKQAQHEAQRKTNHGLQGQITKNEAQAKTQFADISNRLMSKGVEDGRIIVDLSPIIKKNEEKRRIEKENKRIADIKKLEIQEKRIEKEKKVDIENDYPKKSIGLGVLAVVGIIGYLVFRK